MSCNDIDELQFHSQTAMTLVKVSKFNSIEEKEKYSVVLCSFYHFMNKGISLPGQSSIPGWQSWSCDNIYSVSQMVLW